ncbi:MAG: MutS-related protein [Blautia hansenii]
MSETVVGIGIIALLLLSAAAVMLSENKRRKLFLQQKLKNAWGQISDREYTYEDFHHISQFFHKREKEGFFIDDITWNDLDMDRIFMLLNQTFSAVGGDCLYDILRKPVFEEKELKYRNQLMLFFAKNQEIREQVQTILASVRKSGSNSIYENIHVTTEVNIKGKNVQIGFCSAFFLSLLVFILAPNPGVFLFLLVCVVNIGAYMTQKQEVDAYLSSFRNVLQLLEAYKKLEKLKIPELEAAMARGIPAQKRLAGFQKRSSLVIDRSSTGGGLEGMLMDYIRMLTHIDLIKFQDMMKSMKENRKELEELIYTLGYIDSMISIASFRETLPYYTCPEFREEKRAYMDVENLYHPLIENPVANSISAKGGILVTGSNASGKSTFLKNIAINSIFAQTIYTCTASSYCAPYFQVMTSMALRDDLGSGESYYIVEIRSLKRILDAAKSGENLLCIIDEVLRGTNTIERIGASSQILANICKNNVLSFAATHDIELSYMLQEYYENYHFEEEVREKDVVFNYLLKKGRVTTRNAIRLLEMIGYDKTLIEEAKRAVEEFEASGSWKNVEKAR